MAFAPRGPKASFFDVLDQHRASLLASLRRGGGEPAGGGTRLASRYSGPCGVHGPELARPSPWLPWREALCGDCFPPPRSRGARPPPGAEATWGPIWPNSPEPREGLRLSDANSYFQFEKPGDPHPQCLLECSPSRMFTEHRHSCSQVSWDPDSLGNLGHMLALSFF